ncbi:mannosyl-3-phosphoglycerate synthase [Bisporella sp. PMI_857]|nr:mannosyl-3-phosphoglycerate synthase [Bisporella sp. PMI_857]
MRFSRPTQTSRLGTVQVHGLQHVVALESGTSTKSYSESLVVSPQDLITAGSKMVLVVFCMNEALEHIEGVLSAIPYDNLIVLVSNSEDHRYERETELLKQFCQEADRKAVSIHQKDPGVAKSFAAIGINELVSDDGVIRNGKGEAMVIGMALAAMTGRSYVGFVDGDNFVPGSVNEYCKVFAAGLHLSESSQSMVRVAWNSKPKQRGGQLIFEREGRSSKFVNRCLNRVMRYHGFENDIIVTGNAGEHAMTLELGLKLQLASSFAVEPYQLVYMFENLSGATPPFATDKASTINIYQIKTRNPHFHENKGEEHIRRMQLQGLNLLYHSAIATVRARKELYGMMVDQDLVKSGHKLDLDKARVYPAVGTFDLFGLYDNLKKHAESFQQFRRIYKDDEPGEWNPPPILRCSIPMRQAGLN